MNKLKKLLVILQILMLLWPTAFTVASTINIGDTINTVKSQGSTGN